MLRKVTDDRLEREQDMPLQRRVHALQAGDRFRHSEPNHHAPMRQNDR